MQQPAQQSTGVCPHCGGSRWVKDKVAGVEVELLCPQCRGTGRSGYATKVTGPAAVK